MKSKRIVLIAITLMVLISCRPQEKYIKSALDIIEARSFKKDKINWKDFRSKVLKYGRNDKTIDDAHNTIKYALLLLHDGHSFFVSGKDYSKQLYASPTEKIKAIESNFENQIGYIKIPGFIGTDSLCKAYADRLQQIIKEIDKNNLNGWIIDLRNNTGGNMWPMLLGIGPIIGDGTAGYFVNDTKDFMAWGYSDGKTFSGETFIVDSICNYELKNKNKKIAVLINNRTMSSGEAIAIAFKRLPNTRFFGEKTRGLTTCNSSFFLSDSSMIALMTAVFADRDSTVYGIPIIPDEIVETDDPKEVAISWINHD